MDNKNLLTIISMDGGIEKYPAIFELLSKSIDPKMSYTIHAVEK